MRSNQIGELSIKYQIHGDKFGYGFGMHTADSQQKNGASVGTFSWAGAFHTYFWVDPRREVVGVLMTQLFPFNHLTLWGDFQSGVYAALDRAEKAD
jgi:CubicO group peptidase (beta-lactamase class C family)